MKIVSSPTQIAAQALAANAAAAAQASRPTVGPRRIQPADLVELTKQAPQIDGATPASLVRNLQTQTPAIAAPAPPRTQHPAPTRLTRPGAQLDIKV